MKVTVYSTTECPYCKMEKAFFKAKGVDYVEKLVDKDEKALEEMQSVSEGHMGTPFTVIEKDGKVEKVVGFDKGRLTGLLGLA